MGIAAYNRGSKTISVRISMDLCPREFVMIDILNSLTKYEDAGTPFGPIQFVLSHGGCFAECPVTGFGFFYTTLFEALKRWRVRVTEYRNGMWIAVVDKPAQPCQAR
jgi:hypothetical protein